MELENSDLLPGENILINKAANACFSKIESIGGKLYLTNYRLIFKSHKFNRLRGKFSIFLSTIEGISDDSFLCIKKLSVVTKIKRFEFIVWEIPAFIKAVENAKAALKEDDVFKIRQYALQYYDRCGEGLHGFGGLEVINKVFLEGQVPTQFNHSKSSEHIQNISIPIESTLSEPFKILREFDVEEDTEILSVDELPLDNRFGSQVLILEQEFSKSANNEISFESTQEQQGKVTADFLRILKAELTLDLSKNIGYKYGESTTCRYITKISVNTGDFIIYTIIWKRKIRRSNYEIQIENQRYIISVVARYGVDYEITSKRKE